MDLAHLSSIEQDWAQSPINSTQNREFQAGRKATGWAAKIATNVHHPCFISMMSPWTWKKIHILCHGIGEPACFGPTYLSSYICHCPWPGSSHSGLADLSIHQALSLLGLWTWRPFAWNDPLLPLPMVGSFLFLRVNGISSEASPDPPMLSHSYSLFPDTYHNLKWLLLCIFLFPACLPIKQIFSCIGASLAAQTVKNLPAMQETQVRSLDLEDPLEKRMATHSNILAWKILQTEESGGLQSIMSHRVWHDWETNASCIGNGLEDSILLSRHLSPKLLAK